MKKDFAKAKQKHNKICFLVTPIGQNGSPVRDRVDQWEKLIYNPALGKDYEIIRADKIASPGIITEQVIQYIIDADLVIIDYTDLNPNVMYEAAIRHLLSKPYIQIHENTVHLPFDIHNLRSIPYNQSDLSYTLGLVKDIKKFLIEINKIGYKQPQLVKEKFDFDKIVSDPEEFVRLLTKHIGRSNNAKNKDDSIVTIDDYSTYSMTRYPFGRKKIVCPKCKTIKYEEQDYTNSATSGRLTLSLLGGHHYKCNTCGTEFEQ